MHYNLEERSTDHTTFRDLYGGGFMSIKDDAFSIMHSALNSTMPDEAVKKALRELPETTGKIYLTAIGKAAWQMSKAASEILGERLTKGHGRNQMEAVVKSFPQGWL